MVENNLNETDDFDDDVELIIDELEDVAGGGRVLNRNTVEYCPECGKQMRFRTGWINAGHYSKIKFMCLDCNVEKIVTTRDE